MDEETNGFWMVALGAATASGTWEGFRISPLRHTASLHVDGALTVEGDHPETRDYALVLSHPAVDRDRILVAGRGGTIEFGHDLVDSLARDRSGVGPTLWLADLSTGRCSERCELPRAPRRARPADPPGAPTPHPEPQPRLEPQPHLELQPRPHVGLTVDLTAELSAEPRADVPVDAVEIP